MPTRASRKRTTQVVKAESDPAAEERKEYDQLLDNFDKQSKNIYYWKIPKANT